ncbi:mitochondrial carrier domain-containing protein [Cladochytrium replicatum]|nr:mitochondrial carrier domain-containing protein [Cladochytrium replicatum]
MSSGFPSRGQQNASHFQSATLSAAQSIRNHERFGHQLPVPLTGELSTLSTLDDVDGPLGQLFAYAFVKFVSLTMVCPLEVATILQQVQYKPSDSYRAKYTRRIAAGHDSDFYGDETDHEYIPPSDDSDSDACDGDASDFAADEPAAARFRAAAAATRSPPRISESVKKTGVDIDGYLTRASFEEDDPTRPPYQLGPLDGSTWSVMYKVAAHKDEGITSLWKGNFTSWLYDMAQLLLQPTMEGLLSDALQMQNAGINLVDQENLLPNFGTILASHAISGWLLSPLELARTRLIVQTKNRFHRKYYGTWHCLSTIYREEGGFRGLWFGRNFFPAILQHTVAPFFKYGTSVIIQRVFNILPQDSPYLYGMCEFGLGTLELVLTLPLETIRRRLQLQPSISTGFTQPPVAALIVPRSKLGRDFETSVEMSRVPYTGLWDCAWRMIYEEGGERRVLQRRTGRRHRQGKRNRSRSAQRDSEQVDWGFGPLFQGLRMRLFASVIMQLLHFITDDSQ